jgi:acid phosphatase
MKGGKQLSREGTRLYYSMMKEGWLINKAFIYILLAVIFAGLELGCGGGGGGQSDPPPPGTGVIPQVNHVFLLVEENHSYSQVIGNAAMPYTNLLAQQYALATQYYANRFNSLPNYFMLTVGDLITMDDSFTGTVTADNVARAVTKAGKSWKIYAESLPNGGYTGQTVGPYGKDHNPFAYFSDVQNSSSQASNIVPFTQLATDIQNNTLPDYALIVPNFENDGHDCPSAIPNCSDTDKLQTVDTWISQNIGPLIQSTAFQSSVLIYTWDESDINDTTNPNEQVATIIVSPKVRSAFRSTTRYQHQSTLRLTMQLLGINDYPGAAATAPSMTEFF